MNKIKHCVFKDSFGLFKDCLDSLRMTDKEVDWQFKDDHVSLRMLDSLRIQQFKDVRQFKDTVLSV